MTLLLVKQAFNHFFEYRDGILYWRKPTARAVRAGSEAGSLDTSGYRRVRFFGRLHLTHRIIFALHHGYLPECVDHIDGDPLNNKIENLRASTKAQNRHNSSRPSTNTSSVKGVSWRKDREKWRVVVTANGDNHYCGLYDDLELAELVATEARSKYHCEFAKH